MLLSQLKKNCYAVVDELVENSHNPMLVQRLAQIGFIKGEPIKVLQTGPGGKEPLAVQVGDTFFALRLEEARHVKVNIPSDHTTYS